MTALRVINIIVWGVMLAYMLPGAWAATGRGARYGDPMRLACALTAILFIAFNGYWLVNAANAPTDPFMTALLVLSAALAVFILKLGRTYGRGGLLTETRDGR
jgi:hypothetical protein